MHLDSKWPYFFLSAMCPCISEVLEKLYEEAMPFYPTCFMACISQH